MDSGLGAGRSVGYDNPNRCCTFCIHNPYMGGKERWSERLWWRLAWFINRLFGRMVFIKKEPEWQPGCQKNPRIFCYEVHSSEGCWRSLATARPEFLACKACGSFDPKRKEAGNG